MKLQLASSTGLNTITGYGPGYITVNYQRYHGNLVLLPDQIIDTWDVNGHDQLTAQHFIFLSSLNPELVVLGTGAHLKFPHPRLFECLTAAQIGMEVMDTHAACRTYNILAAEGRHVLAALLAA